MDEMTPLLTSDNVASYLKVEVITVRRLVKNGKLSAYRVGGEYRFSKEDVETYLQHNYQPARGGILERLGLRKGDLSGMQLRRLSQRAKNVLTYATEETRTLNQATTQFEHILIGLVREDKGVAGKVLAEQGITLDTIRALVQQRLGVGSEESPDCLSLHSGVKQLMETAAAQAKALHHNFVGTEHILLALVGQEEAGDLIVQSKINPDTARGRIQELLAAT